MLRYRNNDDCIEELDPKNRDDVVRLVRGNMVSGLVFDETNVGDAEVFLDQVRRIFGRTSETAETVCQELEKLHVFDMDF